MLIVHATIIIFEFYAVYTFLILFIRHFSRFYEVNIFYCELQQFNKQSFSFN